MLHEFLTANRAALIERCRIKVAQRPTPKASKAELEHGIPHFLDQIIKTLQVEQTSDPMASRRISGPAGGGKPFFSEIGETATQHGRELLQHGFTIDQVVHDYGDLCQAIMDLASERGEPFHIEEFGTLNRCLDNAIADAVTEFTLQHDTFVAEEAVQAMNERLAFLAHELRNLIQTATLAFTAVKSGKVALTGATGSLLEHSLIAMHGLVNHSLAEARVTAGMPARFERISLVDFIRQVKLSATLEAQIRGCSFTASDVDPTLAVDADRDLLLSAVGNLLQNAFKFTGDHTQVSVHAYAAANRILIDIEDHCGGLPSGYAEKMFNPFTQGGPDKSGLGIGLAIARRSVEAMNGILSVRDVPGSGCIFTVDLPRCTPPEPSIPRKNLIRPDQDSGVARSRVPRILIVDDTDTRLAIGSVLQCDGYEVAVAADGYEALMLQKQSFFDVLITDIFMPEKDGLETIREFRRNYPQTRIIAMSGALTNRVDYLSLSLEIGADKILRKPFDGAALKAALKDLFAVEETLFS
jgi:signal transduction histidine kinase/ActR/RegA family two-component response regulator